MLKTNTILFDLTHTKEAEQVKKNPNTVNLLTKRYIDLTVYDFKVLTENGIYGTLKMSELFRMLDERYLGIHMNTWKPE